MTGHFFSLFLRICLFGDTFNVHDWESCHRLVSQSTRNESCLDKVQIPHEKNDYCFTIGFLQIPGIHAPRHANMQNLYCGIHVYSSFVATYCTSWLSGIRIQRTRSFSTGFHLPLQHQFFSHVELVPKRTHKRGDGLQVKSRNVAELFLTGLQQQPLDSLASYTQEKGRAILVIDMQPVDFNSLDSSYGGEIQAEAYPFVWAGCVLRGKKLTG